MDLSFLLYKMGDKTRPCQLGCHEDEVGNIHQLGRLMPGKEGA